MSRLAEKHVHDDVWRARSNAQRMFGATHGCSWAHAPSRVDEHVVVIPTIEA